MRQLLLTSHNKLNWNFIIPVWAANSIPVVVSHITSLKYEQQYYGVLAGMTLSVVSIFLAPTVWGYSLKVVREGNRAKDFGFSAVTMILLHAFWFGLSFSGSVHSDIATMLLSTKSIAQIAGFITSSILFVGFCECFYDKFNNKLLLFYTGMTLAGVVSILVTYSLETESHNLAGPLLNLISMRCIGYFSALLILKIFQLPVPLLLNNQNQEEFNLSKYLQEELKNNEGPSVMLSKAQTEFPLLSFQKIARTYTATTLPEGYSVYNRINVILIIALVSVIFYEPMIGSSGLSFMREHYSFKDIVRLLGQLMVSVIIIVKLKIACDLAEFKAYTYKVIVWLGVVSILYGIYQLIRPGDLVVMEEVLQPLISIVFNIILISLALRVSNNLYPLYKLIEPEYRPESFE